MAASSAYITDMTTVITNGPTAATKAKAIAATGPIGDYPGNSQRLLGLMKLTSVALNQVKTDTDSTDSANLTLINSLIATMNGTASPSTQLLTDIGTVITNGPNAATKAKAIVATGPIMDYVGMCHNVRRKFQEMWSGLTTLKAQTDASDGSLATIQTLLDGLV